MPQARQKRRTGAEDEAVPLLTTAQNLRIVSVQLRALLSLLRNQNPTNSYSSVRGVFPKHSREGNGKPSRTRGRRSVQDNSSRYETARWHIFSPGAAVDGMIGLAGIVGRHKVVEERKDDLRGAIVYRLHAKSKRAARPVDP